MPQLKAIHNHIIFQFEQDRTKHMGINQFEEKTEWGFKFAHTDESMEKARWVDVIAVGHKCPDDIKPGMRVCVDKLKWTVGFKVDGHEYWRTDSDQILLVETGT